MMDTYRYTFTLKHSLKKERVIKVGVAGSGNVEVLVKPHPAKEHTLIEIHTPLSGFKPTWDEVIQRFIEDYPYAGLHIILYDAGATPPVVALRLRQALETYQEGYAIKNGYTEASARHRIYSLVDQGSFEEFLLDEETPSPTLPALHIQTETDDGVVIGKAHLAGLPIAIAAQQKDFIGGSVGEIHGAKLIGLIRYAIKHRLYALIFLIDSGGVRLQEANVGEIEISELIRCVLEAQQAGIKTIGLICGTNGAYGGMGIFSGVLDYLIVNQGARIGISGAEVIEAVKGKEVFDSSDRALIWRVYGGRTRYMQNAAQAYTSNRMSDIKKALCHALDTLKDKPALNYTDVFKEHLQLQQRLKTAQACCEEGEWLAQYKPDYAATALFDCNDAHFLSQVAKGTPHD